MAAAEFKNKKRDGYSMTSGAGNGMGYWKGSDNPSPIATKKGTSNYDSTENRGGSGGGKKGKKAKSKSKKGY